MAQSKSFFDHVKKELECSVCQEQFSEIKEPKILKCLHTFCKTCLEAWLRQQCEGQMSCPTCRQITECPNNNIDSLPSNLFYKQMVEIVEAYSGQGQEADSPLCGNCEKKKTLKSYCFDCNSFLCEDCAGAHKNWKIFKGHHVKEIGKFESSDMQDYARKANICKKHKDEKLKFYCDQCKICICSDCVILEHRDDRTHNIISFDQGLEKKKSEITNKMQDVEAIGCRLKDQRESLEKRSLRVLNSIDQTTDEVHRVAEHWISLIRQQESAMTKELLEQKKNFQAAFSAQMSGLDDKLMEIDGSLEFGKDVLERKNLPEILNVEEILEQRFQDLLSSRYEFQDNLNYSGVNFIPSNTSSMNNGLGKLVVTSTEPSLSIAQGMGLTEGLEGEDCTFTIITKDSQGQTTYSEIDNVMVEIQSQTGRVTKPNITSLKDGRYEVKYRPENAGIFSVSITVEGEAIKSSPFQLSVKERMPRSQGKEVKRQSSDPQHSPGENQSLKCHLCMSKNIKFDQLSLCLNHSFCMSCRRNVLSDFHSCPLCADKNRPQGNQPSGHMSWRTETKLSLPDNKDCGTIIVSYNFDRGVQGPEHPNPGVPNCCFFCPSYLPDNQEGRALCILLRRAFNSRSLFTVGTSPSTGAENSIVCDGIELKTSQSGGPANCGYPDAGYLDRLKKQLAEKGFCLK